MKPLSFLSKFMHDRSGAFAVMTALIMPALLVGALFALEFAMVMVRRNELQRATDTTALSLAQLSGDNPNVALNDLKSQAIEQLAALLNIPVSDIINPDVTVIDRILNGITYKELSLTYSISINGINGPTTVQSESTASANTSTPANRKAFSIFLAIDTSGSMSFTVRNTNKKKMDLLKESSKVLFAEFSKSVKDEKAYIRTGGVFFDYDTYSVVPQCLFYYYQNCERERFTYINPEANRNQEQPPVLLDSNLSKLQTSIEDLTSQGGTRIYPAVDVAVRALTNPKEKEKSILDYGIEPELRLIILSDGANMYWEDDNPTLASCKAAKAKNITVSALFFPDEPSSRNGNDLRAERVLKECVSSPSLYVNAGTPSELVSAMKLLGTEAIKSKAKLIR